MTVIKLEIEESKVNKSRMILIVTTQDGKKYVMAGDSYNPTYLIPYENAFDIKPLKQPEPPK